MQSPSIVTRPPGLSTIHIFCLSPPAKCRLDLITINPFSGHFHNLILLPFFQISFPLFMNYSRQRQEYQAFPL